LENESLSHIENKPHHRVDISEPAGKKKKKKKNPVYNNIQLENRRIIRRLTGSITYTGT
jgi:hypothetical protein